MISCSEYKPAVYSLSNASDREQLIDLLRRGAVTRVVDEIHDQELEYFQVLHPDWVSLPDAETRFAAFRQKLEDRLPVVQRGKWVFYPWLSTLVHILDHDEFYAVRTARNRGLITTGEQFRFYNTIVGIAGLSLGNSVALAIVLSGGAKHIRLADFDTLSLSNTNRVRSGVEHLGLKKVVVAARQIYALNPYAVVEIFDDGLNDGNIEKFFAGPPVVRIMIDEIDDFAIKTKLRQYAREYRIPVVTGYDIGDASLVDVERYDLDPKTPLFNGSIPDISQHQLKSPEKLETGRLLAKHIGPENVPQRLQESFFEVGKTLVSWPQLGTTALLNGSAIAYCVRKLANDEPLLSKRICISFDQILYSRVWASP